MVCIILRFQWDDYNLEDKYNLYLYVCIQQHLSEFEVQLIIILRNRR